MTHSEFREAYAAGAAKVDIDASAAARYVSARLMLPFVMMPVVGAGVALALVGWTYTGLAVMALGIVVPRLIKRSATNFVLMQALHDDDVYAEVTGARIMRITVRTER